MKTGSWYALEFNGKYFSASRGWVDSPSMATASTSLYTEAVRAIKEGFNVVELLMDYNYKAVPVPKSQIAGQLLESVMAARENGIRLEDEDLILEWLKPIFDKLYYG